MTTPDDPYAGQPAPDHGQSVEQPAIPPQQPNYYGQPPAPYPYGPRAPQPPSRGAWFAIGAASMFGFLVVAVGGFFMILGILLGGDYEGGDEDGYYYVEQRSVLNAVEEPCEDMLKAGAEVGMFDNPKKVASGINAFAVTAQGIADAIASANPNEDSKKWQADWETLSSDLTGYAGNLSDAGAGALYTSTHRSGEMPAMVRMAYSSDAYCEVPSIIVALDPEVDEYNSGGY